MNPLVSVIIPTYKRSDTLTRAIDSVLNQTYPNIEIIVVDDNGEGTEYQKATEQRLKGYIESSKITYIKHKVNKNGSAARNTGFRASKGEYINFLDDDDIFLKVKIATQIQKLRNTDKFIGGTYATINYLSKNRKGEGFISPYYGTKNGNLLKDFLLGKLRFNTSGLLFKREVIEFLNGFDESYRRHQDFEFMIRFFRNYQLIASSNSPLYYVDTLSNGAHGDMGRDRINFEIDFAQKFSRDLEREGCYNSFLHFMLWQCSTQYLAQKNYGAFLESFKKSFTYSLFSFSELKTLAKIFIKNMVK